jgi:hypothetical protein
MIELSVIRDLVAIFGVIAGLSYYILTVRNANRARKQTIVDQFHQHFAGQENQRIFIELLQMEWDDYEDYLNKYDSEANIDNYTKRAHMWGACSRIGYAIYQGNVDVETVLNLIGYPGIWFLWNKFKPIILEDRKRYGDPVYFRWFEYLAEELRKERIRQGLPAAALDPDGYTTN